MLGLVPADGGKVLLDGRDVTSFPMYRRAREGVGYLPQEASIFRRLSVEDNLLAVLELRNLGSEAGARARRHPPGGVRARARRSHGGVCAVGR